MPFILLLLFFTVPVQAEIFQWFDAKGNKHFSDKPHLGAKAFEVDAGYSYYQVKKVYDGDTVLLSNGQKVRFLGINTPEVEGRSKSLQAGGGEAKKWLIAALNGKKIRLEKDFEKHDKYGRLLAHLFTEDNQHLNLELVKQGLASVSIFPPNLKYTDELVMAEQLAEQKRLGIWNYSEYAIKPVADIVRGSFKGWQRILGVVTGVRHTRKNSYLNLSDRFSVQINKKALPLFPVLENYVGRQIEVRGWINKYKNGYSMFVRHPSAMKSH